MQTVVLRSFGLFTGFCTWRPIAIVECLYVRGDDCLIAAYVIVSTSRRAFNHRQKVFDVRRSKAFACRGGGVCWRSEVFFRLFVVGGVSHVSNGRTLKSDTRYLFFVSDTAGHAIGVGVGTASANEFTINHEPMRLRTRYHERTTESCAHGCRPTCRRATSGRVGSVKHYSATHTRTIALAFA